MSGTTNPPPPPKGVVHTAWAKAWDMARTLPALERQAFEESLEVLVDLSQSERTTAFCALYKVLYARFRSRKIARNDKQSRTIIGARVPRAFAEMCKWAAQCRGLSTTQWCRQALQAALTEFPPPPRHDDPVVLDDDDDDDYTYLL